MDKQNLNYKYNTDSRGILQFRREIQSHQQKNAAFALQIQKNITKQNSQSLTKYRERFLQNDDECVESSTFIDMTETRQQKIDTKKPAESPLPRIHPTNQFLPFIKERDSVGRLIIKDNFNNISPNRDQTNKLQTYKKLMSKLSTPILKQIVNIPKQNSPFAKQNSPIPRQNSCIIKQNVVQKNEPQTGLNKILNDFLGKQKLSFSQPTSSANLQESYPQFKNGFIIKEDKVKGYCNEINYRNSSVQKEMKSHKNNEEQSCNNINDTLDSKQKQRMSHQRHSSDLTHVITSPQASPFVYRNINNNFKQSQAANLTKHLSKLQMSFIFDSQRKLLQKKSQPKQWISFIDNIHNSDRYAPFPMQKYLKQTNESKYVFSEQPSRMQQNDHDLSELELKQILGQKQQKISSNLREDEIMINIGQQYQQEEQEGEYDYKMIDSQQKLAKKIDSNQRIISKHNIANAIPLSLLSPTFVIKDSQHTTTQNYSQMHNQQNHKKLKVNQSSASQGQISNTHSQSTQRISQNYYVNNNANQKKVGQQTLQNEKEDDTFTELFKGVKVQQSDIDRFVKHDLGYLGNIRDQGEERIANFSSDNVSKFINDINILKNRSKKLKKNINQMPESAMTNLRDIDAVYNQKNKYMLHF